MGQNGILGPNKIVMGKGFGSIANEQHTSLIHRFIWRVPPEVWH